jgi:hypothetical protein
METKNTIVIPTPKKIFCRVQIQDLIVDVLYNKGVRIGDASGEVPKVT